MSGVNAPIAEKLICRGVCDGVGPFVGVGCSVELGVSRLVTVARARYSAFARSMSRHQALTSASESALM